MYEIILGKHAKKFLKTSEKIIRSRVIDKIKQLAENPFPTDAKRVLGEVEKIYRIRVGDYRITYILYHENNEILIVDIDKRAKIYS
jgi:mRNA interferase RelE/StbE